MSKLLVAPRVPKEISNVSKPKRVKKTLTEDIKVNYKVIKEGGNSTVTKLFELYKLDRFKARVKFMSSPHGYSYRRLVIFEFGEKDFEVTEFENKFGISVTNRIYSSQKKTRSLVYKKGKFYYIDKSRNKLRSLTYFSLVSFISDTETGFLHTDSYEQLKAKSEVYRYFITKFPWVQTLSETDIAKALSFSTIIEKKLTGQKDLLRHVFKVPINIVNVILKDVSSIYEHSNGPRNPIEMLKQWREVSKVLDNIQSLTPEFYHHYYFYDTCTMAHKLGRKVNCKWGLNKLGQVHDDWAKDLRNILLDCEIEYKLKVRKPFFGLAKYTGWKLLFTNKEMLVEGVRQNHCVGGYIDRVERGECAIFHVEGYTLQVSIDRGAEVGGYGLNQEQVDRVLMNELPLVENEKPVYVDRLKNMQFRGENNCDPSPELRENVNAMLEEYSQTQEFKDLVSGKLSVEEIGAICSEIYKTKWEVVINHETKNYEIKQDVGLGDLEMISVLDLGEAVTNNNNLLFDNELPF